MTATGTLNREAHFGQYRIVRLLGRGGMGEVYEVEHRVLHRRYALKLLPQDFAGRAEAVRRFEREAEVMANLEHPHIVRVDEFGETEGRYWLRMELAKGVAGKAESRKQKAENCVTLGEYAAGRGGRIEQGEFAAMLKQILEALAYAHGKGVVHRDLKPGNILLEEDAAGGLVVKVSDFGLARVIGEEVIRSQAQISVSRSLSLGGAKTLGEGKSIAEEQTLREEEGTSTRALLGTWEYMSPEQRRGEEADARSDVYALGLMSYRLLTGEELGRKAISQLLPEATPAWDGFVDKALEQKAGERYADGRAMLAASEQVVRAIAAAREAGRQAELRRAQEERQRQEAEAARSAAEAAVVRQREAQRQAAQAEAARAAEEQAKRRQRGKLGWRRLGWAGGIGALALAGWGVWYYAVAAPAERARVEQARIEEDRRAQEAAEDARRKAEAAAAAEKAEQARKAAAEQARLEQQRREQQAAEDARRKAEAAAAAKRDSQPKVGQGWTNSLGMVFVRVPGTEVLFGIWDVRVRDYAAYAQANSGVDGSWQNLGFMQGDSHPVVNVSWNDAKAFCRWLTQKEQAAGKIGADQSYRLPADAEWSVAVGLNESRAGTPRDKDAKVPGVYPWGSGWPPPRGAGNYGSSLNVDSFDYTSPVGSFGANRFGLYDMGGNVWQWCEDSYDGQGASRVLRGASWYNYYPVYLLSSYRCLYTPVPRLLNFWVSVCVGGGVLSVGWTIT